MLLHTFLNLLFNQLSMIHPEQSSGQHTTKVAKFSRVLLLGVSLIVSGQFYGWNAGYLMGFWPFFVAVLFTFSGYLCLSLCLAEMSSAIPFSGGTYGLARVTLGNFPAYLIGITEIFNYLIYVAFTIGYIGGLLTQFFESDRRLEPLYWFLFYVFLLLVHSMSPKTWWNVQSLVAIALLVFVLLYCCLSAEDANFRKYVGSGLVLFPSRGGQIHGFFKWLPEASWLFLGVETLPLASADTVQANKNIPKAIMSSILIAGFTGFSVLFSSAALAPGYRQLFDSADPLSFGYSHMLHIRRTSAVWFTILSQLGIPTHGSWLQCNAQN